MELSTRTVTNLSNPEDTMEFDLATTPTYAVRAAKAYADRDLVPFMRLWKRVVQEDKDAVKEMDEKWPLTYGRRTVACGDWCTRLED